MAVLWDVDIEDYHRSDLVSNTKLSYFADRGPRAYWAHFIKRNWEEKGSIARTMGTIFEDALCKRDTWCLEPEWVSSADKSWATKNADKLDLEPVSQPQHFVGKSSIAAREWAEKHAKGKLIVPPRYARYYEWLMASKGKEIAPQGFADFIHWGLKNFEDNLDAKQLVDACKQQPTLRCSYDGLPGIQARPDFLGELHSRVIAPDLKTTERLSDFAHSAGKFGYAQQAAITRYCLAREFGVSWEECDVDQPFIVVEKTWPFTCAVVRLNPDHIRMAWDWCQRQMDLLADHMEADEWPQRRENSIEMDLPDAYLRRYAA